MKELLLNLLLAVITAAVPVITTYAVGYINKAKEKAEAETNDTERRGYITEIADAVSDAVKATSQTYVDALKQAGKFTTAAQHEAAKKALVACIASISPAATDFIEEAYGDIKAYLTTRIEAEVRKQKNEAGVLLPLPVQESTADATAVAATTAAATAASYLQAALNQIDAGTGAKTEQAE